MSMMAFGYIMLSFSVAIVDGSYGDIINAFTSQSTGHLQIHHKKYLEDQNNFYAIADYKNIIDQFKDFSEVDKIAPRINGGGLAFANKKSAGVQFLGIDWDEENNLTNINSRIEFINKEKGPENQVYIGKKIAKILKLNVGDSFAMISNGVDGSIANDMFFVQAIMKESTFDDMNVYSSLAKAQEFFSLYGQVTHLSIKLKNIEDSRQFSLTHQFENEAKMTLRPWQEVEKDFFVAMEMDKNGNVISELIIIIIVSMGVLNTILMSLLERTKEFGLLKAIGTKPSQLASMISLEIIVSALMSIFIAFFLAWGLNYYFSINGIKYDEAMTYGGMTFSQVNAAITIHSFLKPAIVILGSSILVSIIPMFKVIRMKPMDGLRDL